MSIPYDNSFSKELSKIINSHASAYLKDDVGTVKTTQRKSPSVARGPLYIKIAQSAFTQVLQQDDDSDSIFITPFVQEPNNQAEVALWLGLSVRFDYESEIKDYALTSISASFIRGSQSKQTLLRAEWDSRCDDSNHAQPHWHAIPGQATQRDSVESRWSDIQSHLHLAMCARWRHNADGKSMSHTHNLHAQDVLSWLEQTLLYAKHQTLYCLNKYPLRESSEKSFATFTQL